MTGDWKHAALAGLAAASALGAAVAYHSWRGARDALRQAESTARQQQNTLIQDARTSRRIASREKRRDARTARLIATLRARAAREKTPRQIAAWLPEQLPVPRPIQIQIPPPTPRNPVPAAVATIPQPDLGALRDFVSSCQACSVRLHADRQDLAAKDAQLKLAGERLSAALQQRDAAWRAAKGGGFWPRLAAAFKWFAIGAGAGAALVCGAGHCQ